MISFINALKISRNKIKHKKSVVYIATIISSIAVSILLFFITISNGVLNSIKSYISESLDNEYYVKITPNIPSDILWLSRYDLSKEQVADIKDFEKNYENEESILISDENSTEKTKTGYITNYESPHFNKYIEYKKSEYAKTAKNTLSNLNSLKNKLSISNIYNIYQSNTSSPILHYIGESKDSENLLELKEDQQNIQYGNYDTDVKKSNYTFIEDKFLKKFIKNNIESDLDAIPVIITSEESRKLFNTENPEGKIYFACYRENTSVIDTCSEDNIIKFQVIGIIPLQHQISNTASNINELFTDIINVRYYSGALIPILKFKNSDNYNKYKNIFFNEEYKNDIFIKSGINTNIIAFKTIDAAKSFLNNNSCNPHEDCDKEWFSEIFGLNYLLIIDLSEKIEKITFFLIIISTIIIFAIVFLITMKMMLESRKESAIFRAIGAKKIDILKIYISYTIIFITRVIVFSILFTLFEILLVKNQLARDQIIDFISKNGFPNDSFSIVSFEPIIISILISLFLVGIIATIPMSLYNIHRNIISDIKDE